MYSGIDKIKQSVLDAMSSRFPCYPIRFEDVGDETRVIGVGVFSVPDEDFVTVQDYVFDLEASLQLPDGWELLPLVRGKEATARFYPHVSDRTQIKPLSAP